MMMTFEEKLTTFMIIVVAFVAFIIIIAIIDMLLDAKTKKIVEVVEKEKIIEKVVVKQAPVVNRDACQVTVKRISKEPKPLITIEHGSGLMVGVDGNGNVVACNNDTAVNVNLKK